MIYNIKYKQIHIYINQENQPKKIIQLIINQQIRLANQSDKTQYNKNLVSCIIISYLLKNSANKNQKIIIYQFIFYQIQHYQSIQIFILCHYPFQYQIISFSFINSFVRQPVSQFFSHSLYCSSFNTYQFYAKICFVFPSVLLSYQCPLFQDQIQVLKQINKGKFKFQSK
ncbi:hypothetical protein ABPG72_008980 [Tetrahymena utriculariae]